MRASSFEDIIVGQCVIYPPHSCGYIVGQDTINRVVSWIYRFKLVWFNKVLWLVGQNNRLCFVSSRQKHISRTKRIFLFGGGGAHNPYKSENSLDFTEGTIAPSPVHASGIMLKELRLWMVQLWHWYLDILFFLFFRNFSSLE